MAGGELLLAIMAIQIGLTSLAAGCAAIGFAWGRSKGKTEAFAQRGIEDERLVH